MKTFIISLLLFSVTAFSQEKNQKPLTPQQLNAIKTETLAHINDFRKEQKLPLFYIDKTTTTNAQKVAVDLLTKNVVMGEIPIECGTTISYLTYREVEVNVNDKLKPYISNLDFIFMGIAGSLSDWKPENNQYRLGIGVSEYTDKPGNVTLVVIAKK